MLTRLIGEWSLADSGIESHVVAIDEGGPHRTTIESLGVPVTVITEESGPSLLVVARLVHRLRPDIIQTWMYRADLVGTLASCLPGQGAVVWNLRCSFGWAKRGLARRASSRVYECSRQCPRP